jgi:hypothetical protein
MAERVEIGFAGGQVVATRLSENALEDLRKALRRSDGWEDVETEDGRLYLDLARVVFLRVSAGEHRVGFITEG